MLFKTAGTLQKARNSTFSFVSLIQNTHVPNFKTYLGTPLKPELEDIIVPSALDHFVTGIVFNVVVFVRLKQVVGTHLVATCKGLL